MRVSYTQEVPMGHRLRNHGGNCRFAHGHNYTLTVTLDGPIDLETGMVVDFAVLKAATRGVLLKYDHAFAVQGGDPLEDLLSAEARVIVTDGPPTAELLALRWRDEIAAALQVGRECVRLRVAETRDCEASA